MPVYDVATPESAVGAAISTVGDQLNPDLSYVDIEPRSRRSPRGAELPPATVAAGEGLVALELGMTVYDVESEDHAVRIARSEIGRRLEGIPLERVTVSPAGEEQEGTDDEAAPAVSTDDEEASLLPEFEEMVEREHE